MATLILTTVGTVVGGPIGAAVGAIIGQQIDQVIFAPKGRQGPRLGDLSVQTSSYGSAIPKLFGATRVAGTVVWATDLKEDTSTQSNGKGRPKTTTFSYSASFAVALSGRAIVDVGRIWADGKLLRGVAGDLKSPTGFRLYKGSETQQVDPLIASSEGLGQTPAYRGIAYAVFEDMQLADFGNRIPSLSFEVFADSSARSVGSILTELMGDGAASDGGTYVDGLIASGDSIRGLAETIARVIPFSFVDAAPPLIRFAKGPSKPVRSSDFGSAAGDGKGLRLSLDRGRPDAVPSRLSLGYYDPARDYQQSAQSVRSDDVGIREDRLELSATLSSSAAKAIAENRLAGFRVERTAASTSLPWRSMDLTPGDRISLSGAAGSWRIRRTTFEAMVMKLELTRDYSQGADNSVPADSGTGVAEGDEVAGPTSLLVLDLPQIGTEVAIGPRMAVAANGASAGWRRAPLLASLDGGASFTSLGATALPAAMGSTETALGAGSASLLDSSGVLDVRLINDRRPLADADTGALLAGANTAMVGTELIQFGRATPLGGARYRLTNLLRGRRGTEWAASGHVAGEPFAVIETAALFEIPPAFAQPGLIVMATGLGDPAGATVTGPAEVGAAALPLSPVSLVAVETSGDWQLSWTRRSRQGWAWYDGIDVPIGEQTELYRVTRTVGPTAQTFEVSSNRWTYTAAMRAIDAASGAAVASVAVRQVGSHGVSRPVSIILATS